MSELASIECLQCRSHFEHPNPFHGLCSDNCRKDRRRARDGVRWETRKTDPKTVLAGRLRNRAWAQMNRGCKAQNHWLKGAPPYGSHLPGGAMTVAFRPLPQWPVVLRNTRGLHGALTALLGVGHPHRNFPNFSLIPWQSGWAVYWLNEEGLAFANRTLNGALYDRPTEFTFGPVVRFRAPTVKRRGHQRVRVDAVTPVFIRSMGSTVHRPRPTEHNLQSALAIEFARKLGISHLPADDVCVKLLSVNTAPALVRIAGKFGCWKGWTGSVELDANAPARWLLGAAERIGLGGRTAFGCGRIRLTELP